MQTCLCVLFRCYRLIMERGVCTLLALDRASPRDTSPPPAWEDLSRCLMTQDDALSLLPSGDPAMWLEKDTVYPSQRRPRHHLWFISYGRLLHSRCFLGRVIASTACISMHKRTPLTLKTVPFPPAGAEMVLKSPSKCCS